jgi:hypothetical protein
MEDLFCPIEEHFLFGSVVVPAIRSLYINNNKITDAGLKHLAGLAGLQDVSLARTGVTDEGLKHFKGLKGVRTLYLNGTRVTDAGIDELRRALPEARISH